MMFERRRKQVNEIIAVRPSFLLPLYPFAFRDTSFIAGNSLLRYITPLSGRQPTGDILQTARAYTIHERNYDAN